jgi:hypothetical protein
MQNTPYLTPGHEPELTRQIKQTVRGMAHFAGTGPAGATCGQCDHLGYVQQIYNAAGDVTHTRHSGGCAKFFHLTQSGGPAVPRTTPACRHFEPRADNV